MSNRIEKLLSSTQINDIPTIGKQELLQFNSQQPIKEAYEELSNKGVLSAPVYDDDKKTYIGMLDLRDFVTFVLSLHLKGGPIVFSVKNIVDFSGVNPFVKIKSTYSALDLLELLTRRSLHRVAVMDKSDEKVTAIASQSSLVYWLADHLDVLEDQKDQPVKDLGYYLGGVSGKVGLIQNVHLDDPVQKAFTLIDQYNIHGVPVLDENDQLVGNISVTDMKYILQWELELLNAPIKEFFKNVSPQRQPPITVNKNSTLGEVITEFAKTKVHRLYCVDDNNKLCDVITLTNVLETIHSLCKPSNALKPPTV